MFASESKLFSGRAAAGIKAGSNRDYHPAERAIVKSRPQDFLVSESLILPVWEKAQTPKFTYLRVTKMGFTTFEAVSMIGDHFGLLCDQVLFAGLKDEDAITDQVIAAEGLISDELIARFNVRYNCDTNRFMSLQRWGVGNEPIRIGQLSGNSFRVVIRNLSELFAQRFAAGNRYTFQFLNYYDTQRFGLSQQLKVSHLIGRALIDENFDDAFELITRTGTPESKKAPEFASRPREFFGQLNPQLLKFFKDSYASYLWNQSLAQLVRDVCAEAVFEECCENISFLFARKQSDVLSVLKKRQSLEFTKFYNHMSGNGPKLRATVIQTQILCNSIAPDEDHPGAYKIEFSFFLPSGSYATMTIKQLVSSDFPNENY
jgi:tRNA pseudouridine13 synthase